MLFYAFLFFILAVVAGAFGFGFVASTFAFAAKLAFFAFIVLFLVTVFSGMFRRAAH